MNLHGLHSLASPPLAVPREMGYLPVLAIPMMAARVQHTVAAWHQDLLSRERTSVPSDSASCP
jgi:hypothetical protein